MAGKRDIQFTKGDDYSHVVTITNSSGAIDITGRTYSAQIKRVSSQMTPDATFVCTVTNGAAGEVTLYLSDTQTDALAPARYNWDLQEDASGVISTILAGTCKVVQDVTT